MTRTAAARDDDAVIALLADGVGLWTPWVAVGQVVDPGAAIGVLEVLGAPTTIVSGATRSGRATQVLGAAHHRAPVDFGTVLVAIDPSAAGAAPAVVAAGPGVDAGGLVFRAPSSGRYYGRPAPGKPAFVTVGDVVGVGQTVAFLEVMKTFHRVTYGGTGLPERARVVAIVVADDADVGPGDVLLRLEAVL